MKPKFLEAGAIGLFLLACLIVAGCGTPPHPQTASLEPPPAHLIPAQGIWVPDQFTAYSVGRYVDPNSPDVMHDAHTLYRREESGRWNLTPSGSSNPSEVFTATAGQQDANLMRDALKAELNRQRATSVALIEQAKILDAHLRELNAQSQEFREVLRQFNALRDTMSAVSNRVDTLEYQLRNPPQPAGR